MSEDAHALDKPAYTPPPKVPRPFVGSHIRWSGHHEIAEVTEHTERGFKYRGDHKISFVNQGVYGTGEGEVFTDIPEWDWAVSNGVVELLP